MDQVIGELAFSAKGLVKRVRLLEAEITEGEIRHRLASGALIPKHPGIYRVGHAAPSVEADYLAAVWACGEGSRLSGRAGAYLVGLLKGPPPPPEVTSPGEHRLHGVITHRSRHMHADEAAVFRSIPVMSVPRLLVDLAAVLPAGELARACHEAGVRYHTTPAQVKEVLARRPNAPGSAKLRAVMSGEERVALSKLERGFLSELRNARLPLPQANVLAGGRRVDCRWPEHRLTVELDSYRYHNSLQAWQRDRRREREAYARGDEYRRYTWHDVFDDSAQMLAELRKLLRR